MAHMEKETIERYVYAVTKRLPHGQREDIAMELHSLIDEMVQAKGGDSAAVEDTLLELGDPALLADTYRGTARYVIGPHYFDLYVLVLKIVGFAVTLGIAISLGIGMVFNAPAGPIDFFSHLAGTLFGAYAQGFAWVTIIFWIMEWQQKRKGIDEPLEKWSIESLPEVPQRNAIIPRSEPIASLVFLVLVFAILNSAPWIIRIARLDESVYLVSPFIPAVFKRMLPLFNLTIVIAMGIEFAKLYSGVQSKRLALLTIGLKLVSLAISLYIVAVSGIWNPDLVQQMAVVFDKDAQTLTTLSRFWSFFPRFIVIIMVLGYVVETAETIWRAWDLRLPSKRF